MIGVFDSGSGGLTVLKALRETLPHADVVYFGDIKNAPYGSRSREELSLLTVKAIERLQAEGATSIVSACNSVSASLAVSLFDIFSLAPTSLIEMVGPTVAHFRGSDARILLCATPATIQSEIYQQAFTMVGKDIATLAVPELAGAIEFGAAQAELEEIVQKSFSAVTLGNFDTLILGCTHYPLALPVFAALVAGSSVSLFDPATAVAARAKHLLSSEDAGGGTTRFLISQDSSTFRARVAELFPRSRVSIEVLE